MPSTTPDLANDILSLNRTTERMIFSSFQFTTRKNKKTIEIINDVLGMSTNCTYHKVYFSLSCVLSPSSVVSRSPSNRATSDNHLSEKPKTVAFPKALNHSLSELAESTSRDFWKTPGINTSTH